MRHSIAENERELSVEYRWRRNRRWEALAMRSADSPIKPGSDSHEQFITEHYWGYTARGRLTNEYRVEHPPWRLRHAASWKFEADVATLYGREFVQTLTASPVSAFIAEGSAVVVNRGEKTAPSGLSS